MNIDMLIQKAHKLRQDTFKAFVEHGEAHLGGSFSIIEILIYLYEDFLDDDDIFILSKSHSSFPLCLILQQKGLSPKLTTHLERDPLNGIHCTTGSLGHGLPIAIGIAHARKIKNIKNRVVVLMSDGECQEGTTWESLLLGAKHQLDNLFVIVDWNKIQALGQTEDILPLGNLVEKFSVFGWDAIDVKNGHSFSDISNAFRKPLIVNKPKVIFINTIKSKGVKAFENDPSWHAKKIKGEDLNVGLKALDLL
jgi:transketolase